MAARSFERATFNVPGTKPVPGYLIRCSECGASEKVATNTHGGSMAPEGVAAKFRNKGWIIGTRDGKDVCPECAHRRIKRRQAELEKEATNVIEMPIKAEPPREMSRDDRRVIFAKLNDIYLDEATGYSAGWSDQKVADDLGVPRAWVKGIREENFGSEGASEEVVKLLADAKALAEQFEKAKERATARLSEAEASIRKFDSQIDDISVRIAAIEKRFK